MAAVAAHEAGNPGKAAIDIGVWTGAELDTVIAQAKQYVRALPDARLDEANDLLWIAGPEDHAVRRQRGPIEHLGSELLALDGSALRSGEIRVQVRSDAIFEQNEGFTITLTPKTGGNATIGGNATGTGAITNDDAAPVPVVQFQTANPVVMSRLTVAMPQGWRADTITFNHGKIEPSVSGNSYTWELRDLPPVEIEPASPKISKLVARIAVNIFPPQGKATMIRSFASWKDVSRYNSELSDPQAAFNEQMAAKARELTAGGSLPIALAAVAVHTLAMLVLTGIIALAVYEWFGVAFLRRGWINLDRIWTGALIATGLILLMI